MIYVLNDKTAKPILFGEIQYNCAENRIFV